MMIVTTPVCSVCLQRSQLDVDPHAYVQWKRGTRAIQDAFPDMAKEQREMLISGIHPHCWRKLFPIE